MKKLAMILTIGLVLAGLLGCSEPPDPTVPDKKHDTIQKMSPEERAKLEKELYQMVLKIPSDNLHLNREMYQCLVYFNPDKKLYEDKWIEYNEKILKRDPQRIEKFGPKPTKSVMKRFIKKRAMDPESLKFREWEGPTLTDRGWIIRVKVRAKNVFGAVLPKNIYLLKDGPKDWKLKKITMEKYYEYEFEEKGTFKFKNNKLKAEFHEWQFSNVYNIKREFEK